MTGYNASQLIQFLETKKLVKNVGGTYYLTDQLESILGNKSSPKDALKKFCDACEIPFQVEPPGKRKYTVRYVNDRIGKIFLNILKQVDEEDLIRVTKKYYKETEYPVTIRNYFEMDVWEQALEEHKNMPTTGSSFNKFEN